MIHETEGIEPNKCDVATFGRRTGDSGPLFGLNLKTYIGTMLALFGIGIALRVDYILQHYLWNDETLSLYMTSLSPTEFVRFFATGQNFHPPVYLLWLRTVNLLSFGLLDIQILRYADLVWLPATLATLIWAGIRRAELRIALAITGLVLAVGPTFVYLGAELRSYGMLTFLAVLLAVVVARQLDGTSHARAYVGLSAVTALLLSLTHYVGIVIGAAILGSAVFVAMAYRRRPWLFVASGLIAAAAFLPYSPVLLMQLRDRQTIYSTPASEALGFVMWGLIPVGAAIVTVALAGVVLTLIRRIQSGTSDDAARATPPTKVTTAFLLLSATFFLAFTGAISVVRDVDLLNFGASLTPSILLVFGIATASAFSLPRTMVAVALVAGIFSVIITVSTNRDPSVFEANRISTVDALANAVDVDQSLRYSFGSFVTIVHIDWNLANDYFVDEARSILPAASVILLPIPRWHELDEVLRDTASENPSNRILVITRLPIETRVLPEIPNGFSARVISRAIVEIEPSG